MRHQLGDVIRGQRIKERERQAPTTARLFRIDCATVVRQQDADICEIHAAIAA